MVLNDMFIAPCDEDEVLNSSFAGFIDHVLNQGPVNDRQHLFGHCLSRWQKARAEAGDRKNCFTYRFHA
jgi:hypothetical protein